LKKQQNFVDIEIAAASVTLKATDSISTNALTIKEDFVAGYELLNELGSGGMGAVFKTRCAGVEKELAIKKLHAHFSADKAVVKRFKQEAEIASTFDHPNLVSVYDYGISSEGEPYLVMDYVEGKTLAQVVHETNGIDAGRFVEIFKQVCEALSYAHARQLVHRDLKPTNIMLVNSDNQVDLVKIVDFGIAKFMPEAPSYEQKLTQTGDIIGSPVYMSPEQCLGYKVDERSDIYSLGCVMYESLTGHPPFVGDNVVKTVLKHLNEQPAPLSVRRPDLFISKDLEEIVLQCLSKDPLQRFQSIDDLKRALNMVSDTAGGTRKRWKQKTAQARLLAFLQRRRRTMVWSFALAAVAIGLLAVAYKQQHDEDSLQHHVNYARLAESVLDQRAAAQNWAAALSEASGLGKSPWMLTHLNLFLANDLALLNDPNSETHYRQALQLTAANQKLLPERIKALQCLDTFLGSQDVVGAAALPSEALPVIAQGKLLLQQRNTQAAIDRLEKALTAEYRFAESRIQICKALSEAYYQRGLTATDGTETFQSFYKAALFDSSNKRAKEQVERLIKRELQTDPRNAAAHQKAAFQRFVSGNFIEAAIEQRMSDYLSAPRDATSMLEIWSDVWLTHGYYDMTDVSARNDRPGMVALVPCYPAFPGLPPIRTSNMPISWFSEREKLIEENNALVAIVTALKGQPPLDPHSLRDNFLLFSGSEKRTQQHFSPANLHFDEDPLLNIQIRLGKLRQAEATFRNHHVPVTIQIESNEGPTQIISHDGLLFAHVLSKSGKWTEADRLMHSLIPMIPTTFNLPVYHQLETYPAEEILAYIALCQKAGRTDAARSFRQEIAKVLLPYYRRDGRPGRLVKLGTDASGRPTYHHLTVTGKVPDDTKGI
jgi:tRNA A-37 threonylcarbamoyl transferase component Bud32